MGRENEIFGGVIEHCKRADFVENVMRKAHYHSEDRELLWEVLKEILECMEDAVFRDWEVEGLNDPKVRAVVMTLGAGVDRLQEAFLSEGKLTEAYMVEVLGSEILLRAYGAYNAWVKAQGKYVVRRYYFLGAREESGDGGGATEEAGRSGDGGGATEEAGHPGDGKGATEEAGHSGDGKGVKKAEPSLSLDTLPGLLEKSGLPVTCTEGFCMIPKKSVAFYAELSQDATAVCEGICMGCGRKDCPNRMEAGRSISGNRTLDHPLTYGYARILGL